MLLAGAALVAVQPARANCPGGFYGTYGILLCPGDNSPSNLSLPGRNMGGDPVDIASGNVFLQITDYTTAGQNPLQLIRYYNSMAEQAAGATFATALGAYAVASPMQLNYGNPVPLNWRTNYDRYLQISPDPSPGLAQRRSSPNAPTASKFRSHGAAAHG